MDNKKSEGTPSFAALLATIRPKTDIELGEKTAQLIEDVKITGKKGVLIYKIEVKPAGGGVSAVLVNDSYKVQAPEKDREASMAYIGDGNRLQRTDPSAMPLFEDEDIRDSNINTATGEIKEPNA